MTAETPGQAERDAFAAEQAALAASYEASADRRRGKRDGVVVTPVEIVDFIVRSVEHVLVEEFGVHLDDDDVRVTDPFAGTGIFGARVLEFAAAEGLDVARVAGGMTCIEIDPDAARPADANLTAVTRRLTGDPGTPGPRVVCADTFTVADGDL